MNEEYTYSLVGGPYDGESGRLTIPAFIRDVRHLRMLAPHYSPECPLAVYICTAVFGTQAVFTYEYPLEDAPEEGCDD